MIAEAFAPLAQPTYLFKHVVIQEVAYESLTHATRAALHERLAHFLETHYGDHPGQYLGLLTYHYERSANAGQKGSYLRRAASPARRSHANEVAIDYYERLLPLLEEWEARYELLGQLGELLHLSGRWENRLLVPGRP